MRIPFVEQFPVVGQFFVFSRFYKVPDDKDTSYDSKAIEEDGSGRVAKKTNLTLCLDNVQFFSFRNSEVMSPQFRLYASL